MSNIIFAHNVYTRFKTLKDTIDIERSYFPDSKIFVACNSYRNDEFFNSIPKLEYCYYLEYPQHKIACTNGLIISLKLSLIHDFDIAIFSHDDVRINPEYYLVFEKHLNSVINNEFDLIYRHPNWIEKEYSMFEAVIMNRKAVETIFKNLKLLTSEDEIPFHGFSKSPEHWFYNQLKDKDLKINVIEYSDKGNKEYNKIMGAGFGFEHLNAGLRGWND